MLKLAVGQKFKIRLQKKVLKIKKRKQRRPVADLNHATSLTIHSLYAVLIFGSFTEDEIRSMQCQPQKHDVVITFGSLDSETLRSVGIYNIRVTELHSLQCCELSKPASTPNVFRLPSSSETLEVPFVKEKELPVSACPGNSCAEELKQGCIVQCASIRSNGACNLSKKLTLGQPNIHSASELSFSIEDVLDDSTNGIHKVESKDSIFKKSNGPNVLPRNFLRRGLVNFGNLCFLNATLQALQSCSLFSTLARAKKS